MIAKCTRCGHQKIVQCSIYSSPAIKCDVCGDYFYENKCKEAALYPPPVNVKEKQHIFTYVAGVAGIFFFLFGIIVAIAAEDASYLIMALIGLIFFSTQFFLVWNAHREYKKREETYQKALADSKARLRSKKYQELLISCSGSNEKLIELLEEYNRRNKLTIVDDTVLPEMENEKQQPLQTQVLDQLQNNEELVSNFFCRKCGTKLFDDSIFCHRCGEKIRIE